MSTFKANRSAQVLTHIKLGSNLRNLFSGSCIMVHLDNRSAVQLYLPIKWDLKLNVKYGGDEPNIPDLSGQKFIFCFA